MRTCNEEMTDSQEPKHWTPAAAYTEAAQIKRRHRAEVSYCDIGRSAKGTLYSELSGATAVQKVVLFTPCVIGK
jgi:hypothetical protein